MVEEVGAKHLGDGEDPLGVGDVVEEVVLEKRGEESGALGAAYAAWSAGHG